MADDLVTVTNNENPQINLEITSYKNIVDVNFLQSIESVISAHNTNEEAHENLQQKISLKANTVDVNTSLAAKADVSTIYTKIETDGFLAQKLNQSDTNVTKQGNNFNGINQLVKLNSSGQLPAIDGSLLTGKANLSLNNITLASALINLGFAGQSFTANGYYKFPNGLIIQWGNISDIATPVTSNQTITFPIAFPNACLNVITQIKYINTAALASSYYTVSSMSATNFVAYYTMNRYWFAVGY